MTKTKWPWVFPLTVCLGTSVGVFVFPFFFPPAFTSVMSVSNAAGFNNKVASVAAAMCALAVLLISILHENLAPGRKEGREVVDFRPVAWRYWIAASVLISVCIGFAGWAIHVSRMQYGVDAGYFVNQIGNAALYHRQLYEQIEMPYGPLLFDPPIVLYRLLAGWQISLQTCFFVMLVVHHVVGYLLLGYVANALPISRSWKWFSLCCFAVYTLQPTMGPNYTWFRFIVPTATLLFCARHKKLYVVAALFGLGEVLNLAVSPEIGFAFAAGAVAYAVVQMKIVGRAWGWALLAVPSGVTFFLLLVGKPYLKMLGLFAGGAFNFIVEPLPHVLLFLVALVWIVPKMLATRWKEKSEDAAVLTACLGVSVALVPVALGRSDPGHVFFNGIGIFLLSMVAMSLRPRWQQFAWGSCLAVVMLLGLSRVFVLLQIQIGEVIRRDGRLYRNTLPVRAVVAAIGRLSKGAVERFDSPQFGVDPILDGDALAAIVGTDTVATPIEIPLTVEEELKRRGQFRPDFYYFMYAVLDKAAEERKIHAFNEAKWAMLPTGKAFGAAETQAYADEVFGIALPYRAKRPPVIIGERFAANLGARWRPVGTVNEYTIYCNVQVEPAQHPH